MKLKTILGTVALAAFFATGAMASSPQTVAPGTCTALYNQWHRNCVLAAAYCSRGYLPNPGIPPACNCVCQAFESKAPKTPRKDAKPAKPKP